MANNIKDLIVPLSNVVADRAAKTVENVLKYTAVDVRRAAQRSIKSGGRTQKSKNYSVSKPGEPPKSHKGTLKQAIRYEKTAPTTYLIGPERYGASKALKTLEYGGTGQIKSTFYADDYVARRRQSYRKRKSPEPIRPRAKKPYRVKGRVNGASVQVRDYLYFTNEGAWERATASAAFQAWARMQRTTDVLDVQVERRPYMRPALVAETTAQKNKARMTRAINSAKR